MRKSLTVANGESVEVKWKGVCRIEMVNADGKPHDGNGDRYFISAEYSLLSVKKGLCSEFRWNETCAIKFRDKQVAV